MPDTIQSMEFRSEGAPAGASAGAYPIYPGRIRFSTPEQRRSYSVRYLPGTMTVSAASPIAFVRKAQYAVPTPSGIVEWLLPVQPTNNHTVVLFIGSAATNQAAPSFATPTNGDDQAFTQVGGLGYQAEITFAGSGGSDYLIAAFTRKVGALSGEQTIKIQFTDPGGGFPNVELVALEYSNVSSGGPSAFVKAQVGEGSETRPNPFPPLDMDATSGQAIVFGMVASIGLPGSGGVGPDVPLGYTGRYAMNGATDTDGLDINCGDGVGFNTGLPQTISLDWTPGSTNRGYAGIALALTKG